MKPNERQVPSVGRIVHYRSASYNQPLGAFVCAVAWPGDPESDLNLLVFDPYGATMAMLDVPYGASFGHWNWPAFVPPIPFASDANNGDK